MGNSQSNVINEEHTKYIEQQKKIIEEQKSEIDKLRGINRPRDEMKVTGERSELLTHKEKIQVLLDIFELPIEWRHNDKSKVRIILDPLLMARDLLYIFINNIKNKYPLIKSK